MNGWGLVGLNAGPPNVPLHTLKFWPSNSLRESPALVIAKLSAQDQTQQLIAIRLMG